MSITTYTVGAIAALASLATFTAPVSADTILPGLYRLQNHPDANQTPPSYGARFDELYNATSDHDVFTLDFDDIQSAAFLTVNAGLNQIRIFGQAFGGRDIGNDYANDIYRGIYLFDFTYTFSVENTPGDDDLWVKDASLSNAGTLTAPASAGGTIFNLTDQKMGDYSFRFGDEDNDAGHRNFDGLSGWGWLNYLTQDGPRDHVASTDWIFTASYIIPTPGALALFGTAGLFLIRRNSRAR